MDVQNKIGRTALMKIRRFGEARNELFQLLLDAGQQALKHCNLFVISASFAPTDIIG